MVQTIFTVLVVGVALTVSSEASENSLPKYLMSLADTSAHQDQVEGTPDDGTDASSLPSSFPSSTANTLANSYIPYFLRPYNLNTTATITPPVMSPLPPWMAGLDHYRLIPGGFPNGMKYHFDGLATVLKFTVAADGQSISYFAKPFASDAAKDYKKCMFFGTGTGPTLGYEICFQNPGVNLLPIANQLWLTIDTSKWGRVDPASLETVADAKVNVSSLVLNAHPACDRASRECYVQHPCPENTSPYSDQVCFSLLVPTPDGSDMQTKLLSRATLPKSKIIQHSHSPCVTPNYVVSKLDDFVGRNPFNKNKGMLKYLHQGEDSLWLVMHRDTLVSRVMSSGDVKFVNNHFWNCYEDPADGAIVVEAVATTENYLDNYFERNLDQGASWESIFHPAIRCRIPANGTVIGCVPMLQEPDEQLIFDYPTFNPLFKMRPDYQWFYGIAAKDTNGSKWFDSVVKMDAKAGKVAKSWSSPGVFMTEFDFIPRTNSTTLADEDDGVLVSIIYNATSDTSLFAVFDARKLVPLGMYKMESVVPFHAHGISCRANEECFTNP